VSRVPVLDDHLAGPGVAESHVLTRDRHLLSVDGAHGLVSSGDDSVLGDGSEPVTLGNGTTGTGVVVEAHFRDGSVQGNLDSLTVNLDREAAWTSVPGSEIPSGNHHSPAPDDGLVESVGIDSERPDVGVGSVSGLATWPVHHGSRDNDHRASVLGDRSVSRLHGAILVEHDEERE